MTPERELAVALGRALRGAAVDAAAGASDLSHWVQPVAEAVAPAFHRLWQAGASMSQHPKRGSEPRRYTFGSMRLHTKALRTVDGVRELAYEFARGVCSVRLEGLSRADRKRAVYSPQRVELCVATEVPRVLYAALLATTAARSKAWVVGGDGCERCRALGGRRVALHEDFAPGAPHPPLHPRCKCTMVEVL